MREISREIEREIYRDTLCNDLTDIYPCFNNYINKIF